MITGDKDNANLASANVTNPQSVSQAISNGTEDSESSGLRYRLPGDRTSPESSDGNVTQIQRSIRAGSPGTIDLSDFQPGATVPNETSQTHPLLQEIQTAIDEADTVIDEADSAIVGDVATDILDAENVIQEASIAVTGEPELAISDSEKLIDKASAKLVTEMEDDLREAYSYMSSIGIPVPTDEELAYAEATGDYLGYIGATTALPANPVGPASSPTYQNANDSQTFAGQDAPPGQSQPTVNNPIVKVEPTHTGSEGCRNSFGPEAETVGAYGAMEACNNTNRCAVQVTQPYDNSGPEQAAAIAQYIQQASQGTLGGAIAPLLYSPENLALVGAGNYQVQLITSWSSNTGGYWSGTNGPIGSYNGPSYQVIIPIGWHCQIDPSTGVVYAVKDNVPQWCGLQQQNWGGPDTLVGGAGNDTGQPLGDICPPKFSGCGPDEEWKGLPGADRDDKVCDWLQKGIAQLEGEDIDFAKFILMRSGVVQNSTTMDAIINALTGGHEPVLGQLLNRFAKWANQTVKTSAEDTGCSSPGIVNSSIRLAIIKFIDHWTSIIPHQLKIAELQKSNTICQSEIPTGGAVDAAYLADTMTKDEWECYHKAHGNFIDPAVKVLDSKRTRITAREADLLYRRKKIDNDEMSRRMREAGVLRDEDRFAIRDLNEHWPAQSEIIRLMNRDVFNAETAEKSKLFDGFESNYTDDAEKYGDALGIPKELMKLYWGAHWQLPSYTMAKEFLYRFNTDDSPQNVRFTEDDFRQLLKQDDWAPGHIDRMIAAAYHPIQKRDAILAYMIHASEDDEFVNQLMKVGYAKDNAQFMQRYYKKRREIADRKASGYPTMRTAVNAYAKCELAESEFQDIVTDISIDEDQTKAAIKAAKVSRKVWERKQAIRTIKRPFLLGLYDVAQATQELADEDVDPSCVDDLIKQWQRERMRRDKFFTAGQLCEYRERGIITQDDQLIALVRIGWQPEDAAVIVTDCGMRISEKQAERARREAERLARQLKQQQKEAEKAARLAECGPPPCPANRKQNTRPVGAGQ
jgi:hypothetical protein